MYIKLIGSNQYCFLCHSGYSDFELLLFELFELFELLTEEVGESR